MTNVYGSVVDGVNEASEEASVGGPRHNLSLSRFLNPSIGVLKLSFRVVRFLGVSAASTSTSGVVFMWGGGDITA